MAQEVKGMTRISIRMDEKLRNEAEEILGELGLNMSSAVNMFIKQLVRQGRLPFVPSLEENTSLNRRQRESLDALLSFAASNRRIESGFKFNREQCYEE